VLRLQAVEDEPFIPRRRCGDVTRDGVPRLFLAEGSTHENVRNSFADPFLAHASLLLVLLRLLFHEYKRYSLDPVIPVLGQLAVARRLESVFCSPVCSCVPPRFTRPFFFLSLPFLSSMADENGSEHGDPAPAHVPSPSRSHTRYPPASMDTPDSGSPLVEVQRRCKAQCWMRAALTGPR
jgi:hypothetical protein